MGSEMCIRDRPEPVCTAIRIGKPARGEQALEAAEQSNGRIIAAVSYTHLTPPTNDLVEISVVAVSLKNK